MFTIKSSFSDSTCSQTTQIVVSKISPCTPTACVKESSYFSKITCSENPKDQISSTFNSQKHFKISVFENCSQTSPLYDSYLPADTCILGYKPVKTSSDAKNFVLSEYDSQDCNGGAKTTTVPLDTCSIFPLDSGSLNVTVTAFPINASSASSSTCWRTLLIFILFQLI